MTSSSRTPWPWLFAPAGLLAILQLQWTYPVTWDEVEFFRATRWIAEGKVPYRDFWEHHTPLQWLLFAPFSALANGAGVGSIVLMRWVEAPVWIALLALLYVLARRMGATPLGASLAPLLVAAALTLFHTIVEYRLDVPGNLAYIAAVVLALRAPRLRSTWIWFGVLGASAALFNMRLAPLIVATAVLFFFCRPDEERWGFNAAALWMLPAAAAVTAAFVLYLVASGAMGPFIESVRLNVAFDRIQSTGTFGPAFLTPVKEVDVAAVTIFVAGAIACVLALRRIRRPGASQVLALLAMASFVGVANLSVNYFYHFQTTLLLLAPLVAALVPETRGMHVAFALLGALLLIDLLRVMQPPFGGAMDVQDAVMREADRRTRPDEVVWDGAGFAIRRRPAYRYWFLPSAVRLMAKAGVIEPYDGAQMRANPPAAIIYGYRVRLWFQMFPDSARYALRHYVPLQRNVWVPGLSGIAVPERPIRWIAPRAGSYRLYVSDVLLQHPWFSRPLDYADVFGPSAPRYEIPLTQLPSGDVAGVSVSVDGRPVPSGVLTLRKGAVVDLQSHLAKRAGVLVVPADLTSICITPEEPFL